MGARSQAKYHGIPGDFKNQCEAAASGKNRRCRRAAKLGSNVCEVHGGKAPQVREAARARIQQMVSPALNKLNSAITARKDDPHIPAHVQMAAARDILDRAGYKPREEVTVHAEFDATRFADWSEADLEQFLTLARRASTVTASRQEEEVEE